MTPQPSTVTGTHLVLHPAAVDHAVSVARMRRAAYIGMVAVAGGGLAIFPLFPEIQANLGIGTEALGAMAAAGFFAALVAELLLAPQADRGRARAMAVTGVVVVALSLVGSAVATEAWQLVAARAVGGLGGGLFMPAASALMIRVDPERSGENLGRLSTAELGGIAVGPLIASVLATWLSAETVLVIIAALMVFAVVPSARSMVERPHPDDHVTREAGMSAPPPAMAFDLLRHRNIWGASLLTIAVMVPVGAYDALWPRFMADLDAGELLIGASYVLFAIPFMVLAAPAGRLADRIGGAATFVRGIGVLLAMICLYAVVTNAYVVTGIGMVESSGQAFAFVGAATAMAQVTSVTRAGTGQGLARAMGLIGATISSAISGVLYVAGGAPALFFTTAAATLVIAVVALGLLRGSRTRTLAA
jgi:MFS family permease